MDTNKNLVNLLDSDDEFPSEYFDVPNLPAYKNDCRFDPIDFKWIHEKKPKDITTKRSHCQKEEDTHNTVQINKDSDKHQLLKRGILKKQDIYCLKAVAELTTCNTLLWFTNFMLFKDLQSNYSFLHSCLVPR